MPMVDKRQHYSSLHALSAWRTRRDLNLQLFRPQRGSKVSLRSYDRTITKIGLFEYAENVCYFIEAKSPCHPLMTAP